MPPDWSCRKKPHVDKQSSGRNEKSNQIRKPRKSANYANNLLFNKLLSAPELCKMLNEAMGFIAQATTLSALPEREAGLLQRLAAAIVDNAPDLFRQIIEDNPDTVKRHQEALNKLLNNAGYHLAHVLEIDRLTFILSKKNERPDCVEYHKIGTIYVAAERLHADRLRNVISDGKEDRFEAFGEALLSLPNGQLETILTRLKGLLKGTWATIEWQVLPAPTNKNELHRMAVQLNMGGAPRCVFNIYRSTFSAAPKESQRAEYA